MFVFSFIWERLLAAEQLQLIFGQTCTIWSQNFSPVNHLKKTTLKCVFSHFLETFSEVIPRRYVAFSAFWCVSPLTWVQQAPSAGTNARFSDVITLDNECVVLFGYFRPEFPSRIVGSVFVAALPSIQENFLSLVLQSLVRISNTIKQITIRLFTLHLAKGLWKWSH